MSVPSEITRITGNIANAYTAVSGKGGTLPSARNSANLPAAIESIPSGGTLITKTITQNGTYNASDDNADGYSQVTVNVSGGGGVETCTLTTKVDMSPGIVHGTIYAYYGNTLITITSKGTYSINKNSLIYIDGAHGLDSVIGLENLYYETGTRICNVTSDIATYKFA